MIHSFHPHHGIIQDYLKYLKYIFYMACHKYIFIVSIYLPNFFTMDTGCDSHFSSWVKLIWNQSFLFPILVVLHRLKNSVFHTIYPEMKRWRQFMEGKHNASPVNKSFGVQRSAKKIMLIVFRDMKVIAIDLLEKVAIMANCLYTIHIVYRMPSCIYIYNDNKTWKFES